MNVPVRLCLPDRLPRLSLPPVYSPLLEAGDASVACNVALRAILSHATCTGKGARIFNVDIAVFPFSLCPALRCNPSIFRVRVRVRGKEEGALGIRSVMMLHLKILDATSDRVLKKKSPRGAREQREQDAGRRTLLGSARAGFLQTSGKQLRKGIRGRRSSTNSHLSLS